MASWDLFGKSTQKNVKGNAVMPDSVTIDLGEMLDISFAAKLHAQLKDETQNSTSVTLVSDKLARIDASCLQVLVSFTNYAKENGIKIHWDNPGQILSDSARLTGLTKMLEVSN